MNFYLDLKFKWGLLPFKASIQSVEADYIDHDLYSLSVRRDYQEEGLIEVIGRNGEVLKEVHIRGRIQQIPFEDMYPAWIEIYRYCTAKSREERGAIKLIRLRHTHPIPPEYHGPMHRFTGGDKRFALWVKAFIDYHRLSGVELRSRIAYMDFFKGLQAKEIIIPSDVSIQSGDFSTGREWRNNFEEQIRDAFSRRDSAKAK